jgi:hypothetical protein
MKRANHLTDEYVSICFLGNGTCGHYFIDGLAPYCFCPMGQNKDTERKGWIGENIGSHVGAQLVYLSRLSLVLGILVSPI